MSTNNKFAQSEMFDLVCTKSGFLDLTARLAYHVQTFPYGGPLSIGDLYHIEIIPIIQNRDLRLSKRRPKDGS